MLQTPEWVKTSVGAAAPHNALDRLRRGQREVISLAEELNADAILMDDPDGRRLPQAFHLRVIDTLDILDTAAEQGLVDVPDALALLQQTNFRASDRVLHWFLARDDKR